VSATAVDGSAPIDVELIFSGVCACVCAWLSCGVCRVCVLANDTGGSRLPLPLSAAPPPSPPHTHRTPHGLTASPRHAPHTRSPLSHAGVSQQTYEEEYSKKTQGVLASIMGVPASAVVSQPLPAAAARGPDAAPAAAAAAPAGETAANVEVVPEGRPAAAAPRANATEPAAAEPQPEPQPEPEPTPAAEAEPEKPKASSKEGEWLLCVCWAGGGGGGGCCARWCVCLGCCMLTSSVCVSSAPPRPPPPHTHTHTHTRTRPPPHTQHNTTQHTHTTHTQHMRA
jgi:hypothetical protein